MSAIFSLPSSASILGALTILWAAPGWAQAPAPDAAGFAKVVQPFLKEHCVSCHGPEKQKGKLRLDTLPNQFGDPLVAEKWKEVVNSVNGHEMPPEEEKQPDPARAGAFAEWLEGELAKAEIAKRATRVVLRRMNRAEYNNTIRDLVGVDFQPAEKFPEDPPAGGFDNIGQALTMSPMQVELYYAAARQILDRALVEGNQPEAIKWHFEPEENTQGGDRYRVKHGKNNILLNDGKNPTENGFTVIHRDSWDKGVGFRDFKVPAAGEYILRFRAAGRVPDRAAVVESAKVILGKRRDDEIAKNPKGAKHHHEAFERGVEHFATHRMYNYGAPRVKITQHLGGTPKVIAEMDVDAVESKPGVYEVRTFFSTESAGISLNYAYDIPSVLENFWMQGNEAFARPTLLVDWLELEGPMYANWPPPSHQKVLFASAQKDKDETAYAREVLTKFMSRAYRRPVQPAEVDAKITLFEKIRAEKPSFVEAIKVPLAAVLASPHFLYLVEPEAPQAKPRPLNSFELASRLSYFLWSSMPDDDLLRAAVSGELAKPAVLRAQVNRLLADPRSDAFVKNFAGQWLGLRKVGANPPSKTLYPEYDRHLEISIVRETEGFFAEILRHDLDARNLIKSDFVTINERLARFYGIPGVKGDAIRRVPAPPESHRGGLVTQASIHSITSNGTRTSPVVRGTWVLKTLLGTDPGLPVANVGEIQPKVPGIDKATVRQRLEIHRQEASCARCHDKIDPLGLALENFNAAGEWRTQEGHGYNGRIDKNDPVIDASAKMPDGTEFVGVGGLQQQLLKKEDLFLTALANQMTTYALGRELGFSDRPMVRNFVEQMKTNRYTVRSLIAAIVTSPAFTTK
jgi:mono/diheme cytochrome c family protein